MNIEAVDLFCGVGGLTHGVESAGIKVVAGIDIDPLCRYAYEENNDSIFINKSVEELSAHEVISLFSKDSYKVLMGCAPCQPFSTYSLRYLKNGHKDGKWKLLYKFSDLVAEIQPEIVSMENVPQLSKTNVFSDFLKILYTYGYFVNWNIINCADYGVPQTRKRLVLLASKLGDIKMIKPTNTISNYKTVADVIKNMPLISDGESHPDDLLHRASKLSELNKRRIQQSKPGGTWHDWDDKLKLKCHTKKTGKGYVSIYGRMEWNKPSPTITTQFYGYGNGRFGHPEQNRALTLREGALLQSFPLDYKFIDENSIPLCRQIGIHIGNAVPVDLGVAIAQSIIAHLKGIGDNNEDKKCIR